MSADEHDLPADEHDLPADEHDLPADEHDLPADEHDLLMEISAAASAADMGPGTLRAYDREGLLKPIRTPSGTRLYTPEMVARARQIKAMRLSRFGAGRRRA